MRCLGGADEGDIEINVENCEKEMVGMRLCEWDCAHMWVFHITYFGVFSG